MTLNPRQRRLLEAVQRQVTISVEDLANQLDVTPQTVRRDVKLMEEARLLARYHGGVGLPSSVENIDYTQRQVLNIEGKRRIAAAVAERVRPGCSLLINIGTTTEEVARALMHHQGLHVVTNNLNVAAILASQPSCEVIVAGGVVRGRDRAIVGEATVDFIRHEFERRRHGGEFGASRLPRLQQHADAAGLQVMLVGDPQRFRWNAGIAFDLAMLHGEHGGLQPGITEDRMHARLQHLVVEADGNRRRRACRD